jgi:hypothetical protein
MRQSPTIEPRIPGLVYLAQAALVDKGEDFVRTQTFSRARDKLIQFIGKEMPNESGRTMWHCGQLTAHSKIAERALTLGENAGSASLADDT